MRRVAIIGAGGRALHDHDVVFRDDPEVEVVAFTDPEPPEPGASVDGIPIRPDDDLDELLRSGSVDEVVLSRPELAHADVMHLASRVLAAGADFRLLRPAATMLEASKPVVAVCAVRTGSGKRVVALRVAELLRGAGLRVAVLAHPALELRDECARLVQAGFPVEAGRDYRDLVERAQAEADVLVWDGGAGDLPFVRPDLLITVVDPLRAGQELKYHPGETNLRLADAVVVSRVDSAGERSVGRVLVDVAAANPRATVVRTASPVTLGPGPSLFGASVLVVEDGAAVTAGGLPYGAATVAARDGGARTLVDPRPYAVGSVADAFDAFPQLGPLLPALGYSGARLADLEATIEGADCDVVVTGTAVELGPLIALRQPLRHATYELRELGRPTLADVLAPVLERARGARIGAIGETT